MPTKPKRRTLYYLASPYSHKSPKVRIKRFLAVQKAAIDLMLEDIFAFSPIAYNHPMLPVRTMPTDWDFWQEYDKSFIDHCSGVVVYTLPGWKESIGVQAEIEYAAELGLPVLYLSPEQHEAGDFDHLK